MLLRDLNISLTGVIWIFGVLIVVFLVFALFIYRKTNPVVSNRIRFTLIALRVIGLLGVLFLIFEPILSISYEKKERPAIAVLIDTSASMALKDVEVKRDSVLAAILKTPVFEELDNEFQLIYYQFSGTTEKFMKTEIDSINYIGDATDIRHSLEYVRENLREENLAGIILLTDGAYNLGGNPVRYADEIGVPIYPIAVGSGLESRDMAILSVTVNRFAYLGIESPVQVRLRNSGYPETGTVLSLKRNGLTIDSKNVNLASAPSVVDVSLHFTPEREGPQKYVLELASIEGEQTFLNNIKTVTVDVLKRKVKIMLISGSVSSDLGFLRRAIENNDNYDLTVIVEKTRGAFYLRNADILPNISEFDVIVLLDYPQPQSSQAALSKLLDGLNDHKIPIVAFIGNATSPALLKRFERFLPLRQFSIKTESLESVMPTIEGKDHPIINITFEEDELQWDWNLLPPVFTRIRGCTLWPDAQILATISQLPMKKSVREKKSGTPAIIIRHFEGRPSVAVLAHGLWRWSLMLAGIGKSSEFYDYLINNLIRWSTRAGKSKCVLFSTNSESFRCDETVVLQAEVYDANYQPVENADVSITVKGTNNLWEIPLHSVGDGHYSGELNVNLPGDYSYQGRAMIGQRVLGVDEGSFSIGEYEAELLETKAQIGLLRMIAEKSEGEFFFSDSTMALKDRVRYSTLKIQRSIDVELWNRPFVLVIVLGALVFEWYIRKRKGMV